MPYCCASDPFVQAGAQVAACMAMRAHAGTLACTCAQVQHMQPESAAQAPSTHTAPLLLALPPEILTQYVWQHLSPWGRLQLRKTCRQLYEQANTLLEASPDVCINLDRPPFQQLDAADAQQTEPSPNERLQAVAKLLRRHPRTKRLNIYLRGRNGTKPDDLSAVVWPQLQQITQVDVEVQLSNAYGTELVPQLLAAITAACPNLREVVFFAENDMLGHDWAPALTALPPSLHTLDMFNNSVPLAMASTGYVSRPGSSQPAPDRAPQAVHHPQC